MVGIILALGANTLTVSAGSMTLYNGEDYNKNNPLSWNQYHAPYSDDYFSFSGSTFGYASCGVHSLAYLFLKTEFKDAGFNAEDAYKFAKDHGIGSNYKGIPAYHFPNITKATNGYIKHIDSIWPPNTKEAHDIIRREYEKGNFMLLSVKASAIGTHIVGVDYVQDDGQIVILDSAYQAKYITDMFDNGYVRNIEVFKVEGLDAKDAPKFWKGEKPGKIKREKELRELEKELIELVGPEKAKETLDELKEESEEVKTEEVDKEEKQRELEELKKEILSESAQEIVDTVEHLGKNLEQKEEHLKEKPISSISVKDILNF